MESAQLTKFLFEACVASGGLALSLKYLFEYLKKKNSLRFKKCFHDFDKLYDLLQKSRTNLDAARILIMKTENGGGIPKLNSDIYASILAEVYYHKIEPVKDHWQRRLVDIHYCKMLSHLLKDKKYVIKVSEAEGMLKNSYEAHDHGFSHIYPILTSKSMFLHISFVFPKTKEDLTPAELEEIDYTVNEVKKLYEGI